jgi:hypothetical protein
MPTAPYPLRADLVGKHGALFRSRKSSFGGF